MEEREFEDYIKNLILKGEEIKLKNEIPVVIKEFIGFFPKRKNPYKYKDVVYNIFKVLYYFDNVVYLKAKRRNKEYNISLAGISNIESNKKALKEIITNIL